MFYDSHCRLSYSQVACRTKESFPVRNARVTGKPVFIGTTHDGASGTLKLRWHGPVIPRDFRLAHRTAVCQMPMQPAVCFPHAKAFRALLHLPDNLMKSGTMLRPTSRLSSACVLLGHLSGRELCVRTAPCDIKRTARISQTAAGDKDNSHRKLCHVCKISNCGQWRKLCISKSSISTPMSRHRKE